MGWFANWRERRRQKKMAKVHKKLMKKVEDAKATLAAAQANAPTTISELIERQRAGDENYALSPVPYAGTDEHVCRDCNASFDSCSCNVDCRVVYIDVDGDPTMLNLELTDYASDVIAGTLNNLGFDARACEDDEVDGIIEEMSPTEEELF